MWRWQRLVHSKVDQPGSEVMTYVRRAWAMPLRGMSLAGSVGLTVFRQNMKEDRACLALALGTLKRTQAHLSALKLT